MSNTPHVKPAAQREFDSACDWYQQHSPQLVVKFILEVQRVFQAICSQPELYGHVSENVRAARTNTFSYIVYFYVDGSRVVVIAILHSARDPAIWQDRAP